MEVKLQQSPVHRGAAARKHLGTMFFSYGMGEGHAGIKHHYLWTVSQKGKGERQAETFSFMNQAGSEHVAVATEKIMHLALDDLQRERERNRFPRMQSQ